MLQCPRIVANSGGHAETQAMYCGTVSFAAERRLGRRTSSMIPAISAHARIAALAVPRAAGVLVSSSEGSLELFSRRTTALHDLTIK